MKLLILILISTLMVVGCASNRYMKNCKNVGGNVFRCEDI